MAHHRAQVSEVLEGISVTLLRGVLNLFKPVPFQVTRVALHGFPANYRSVSIRLQPADAKRT